MHNNGLMTIIMRSAFYKKIRFNIYFRVERIVLADNKYDIVSEERNLEFLYFLHSLQERRKKKTLYRLQKWPLLVG